MKLTLFLKFSNLNPSLLAEISPQTNFDILLDAKMNHFQLRNSWNAQRDKYNEIQLFIEDIIKWQVKIECYLYSI